MTLLSEKPLDKVTPYPMPPSVKKRSTSALLNLILFEGKCCPKLKSLIHSLQKKFSTKVIRIKENAHLKTPQYETSDRALSIIIPPSLRASLPSLLYPLLTPDLPTYLFWVGDMKSYQTFETHLDHYPITKVLFDTTTTPLTDLIGLLSLEKQGPAPLYIDLNWTKIRKWQRLFAYHFATQKAVQEIQKTLFLHIEIDKMSSFIEPLYLQGWIANKLGWSFLKGEVYGEKRLLYYTLNGQTIEVIIEKTRSEDEESIQKITMKSACHQVVFDKKPHHPSVIINTSYPDHCEIPLTHIFDQKNPILSEIELQQVSESFILILKNLHKYPKELLCQT